MITESNFIANKVLDDKKEVFIKEAFTHLSEQFSAKEQAEIIYFLTIRLRAFHENNHKEACAKSEHFMIQINSFNEGLHN